MDSVPLSRKGSKKPENCVFIPWFISVLCLPDWFMDCVCMCVNWEQLTWSAVGKLYEGGKGFRVCGQKGACKDSTMINLHCQPGWIWNHLGDTPLVYWGGHFQEVDLMRGDPSWVWVGLLQALESWTEQTGTKEYQHAPFPASWCCQKWGVLTACS